MELAECQLVIQVECNEQLVPGPFSSGGHPFQLTQAVEFSENLRAQERPPRAGMRPRPEALAARGPAVGPGAGEGREGVKPKDNRTRSTGSGQAYGAFRKSEAAIRP